MSSPISATKKLSQNGLKRGFLGDDLGRTQRGGTFACWEFLGSCLRRNDVMMPSGFEIVTKSFSPTKISLAVSWKSYTACTTKRRVAFSMFSMRSLFEGRFEGSKDIASLQLGKSFERVLSISQ